MFGFFIMYSVNRTLQIFYRFPGRKKDFSGPGATGEQQKDSGSKHKILYFGMRQSQLPEKSIEPPGGGDFRQSGQPVTAHEFES